jgi:predicted TIM-barrel fold metal-dependent hydrolase
MAVTDTQTSLEFVDADGHVLEPPTALLDYAPARYHDRIWHIETDRDGAEWLVWDGDRIPANQLAMTGIAGMGPEVQTRARRGELRYTEIRPGGFDPKARLVDLDTDEISQAVLYPTMLLGIAGIEDVDFAVAQCQAYNDWLAEFCAAAPDRLFGIAVIPQQDVDAAVAEIERCAAKPGFVGTFVRPNPVVDWRFLHDPVYDPLWAAAQKAGWPVGLHPFLAADVPGTILGLRLNRIPGGMSHLRRMNVDNIFFTQAIGNPTDMMTSLACILAGGVCERFPDLRFVVLETNGGWITPWMERLDHHWEVFRFDVPDAKLAPSEYFRRQCWISFEPGESTLVAAARSPYVGAERVIWASDYPHPDAAFPGTTVELAETIAELEPDAQRRIASGNAAELYGLPPRASAARPN